MATTHTRKKPFASSQQPSITSYFDRSSTISSSSQPTRSSRSPLSPPLPDQVQSLLINVGMRVRKSVPEGYKTHKTLPPAYTQTQPQTRPGLVPTSSAPAVLGSEMERGYARPNELVPFCGLHSVGGIASQGADSLPTLGWSQGTLGASQMGLGEVVETKKRSYEDEIEGEMDAFFEDEDRENDGFGAKTLALPNALHGSGRRVLRPKGKIGQGRGGTVRIDGVDFDDTDVGFLVPMEVDD